MNILGNKFSGKRNGIFAGAELGEVVGPLFTHKKAWYLKYSVRRMARGDAEEAGRGIAPTNVWIST